MASKEEEFYNASQAGDIEKVKTLSTQVDVNWGNPNQWNRTALHIACGLGHEGVVKYLLILPQIDVNKGDSEQNTPLSSACWNIREEIVQMLVVDPRVDVNRENTKGITPLWAACFLEYEKAVNILLASGRALETTKRRKDGSKTTAAEIARIEGEPHIAELIEEYERNPKEVVKRLRQELDWPTPTSTVFAQIIFLCDGLLALSDEPSPAQRFLAIASRLPLDLQHLLANRSQGLMRNHVPTADRELAFHSLARSIFQN